MSVASQAASVAGPPPPVQERGKKGCNCGRGYPGA